MGVLAKRSKIDKGLKNKIIVRALHWFYDEIRKKHIRGKTHAEVASMLQQNGFISIEGPFFENIKVYKADIAVIHSPENKIRFALAFQISSGFPICLVNFIKIDPKKVSSVLLTADYKKEPIYILRDTPICPFCGKDLDGDEDSCWEAWEAAVHCEDRAFCSGLINSCKCLNGVKLCGKWFSYILASKVEEDFLKKLVSVLEYAV